MQDTITYDAPSTTAPSTPTLDILHRQPHGNIPKNRDRSMNRTAIRIMMSITKESQKEK